MNDPLGTVASGASNVWGKATEAAAWTGEVASNLATDPAATIGRGVDNTLSTGAAIWHGIADPYAEAYAKGGIAQALGRGTFDVVKLGAEALITKGALSAARKAGTVLAETAKVADKAEDAADAAKKAEEVAQKAEKLEGETESGGSGARITKRTFWKKKRVNGRDVYQRDDLIDPDRIDPDTGLTNRQLMENGDAPFGPDGEKINLHHMTQDEPGAMAEVGSRFHSENDRALHIFSNQYDKTWVGPDGVRRPYASAPSSMDRRPFNRWKRMYWLERAKDFRDK